MSEAIKKGRQAAAQEMFGNLATQAEGKGVNHARGYHLEDGSKNPLCETGCQPEVLGNRGLGFSSSVREFSRKL